MHLYLQLQIGEYRQMIMPFSFRLPRNELTKFHLRWKIGCKWCFATYTETIDWHRNLFTVTIIETLAHVSSFVSTFAELFVHYREVSGIHYIESHIGHAHYYCYRNHMPGLKNKENVLHVCSQRCLSSWKIVILMLLSMKPVPCKTVPFCFNKTTV